MRSKFYRFLAREVDFFAVILFWGGVIICALDFIRAVLAVVVFVLGGPWDRGDPDGLFGITLLALSFLLHKAKETAS